MATEAAVKICGIVMVKSPAHMRSWKQGRVEWKNEGHMLRGIARAEGGKAESTQGWDGRTSVMVAVVKRWHRLGSSRKRSWICSGEAQWPVSVAEL
jgi:hypothetical protein